MASEGDRGHPTYVASGHLEFHLWTVEHFDPQSGYPRTLEPSNHLISIKEDNYPLEFETDWDKLTMRLDCFGARL